IRTPTRVRFGGGPISFGGGAFTSSLGFWRLGSKRSLSTMVATSTVGCGSTLSFAPPLPAPPPPPALPSRLVRSFPPGAPAPGHGLDGRERPAPGPCDLQPQQEHDDNEHAVQDRPAAHQLFPACGSLPRFRPSGGTSIVTGPDGAGPVAAGAGAVPVGAPFA